MKPFNLEEALSGKPVVTEGGDEVIIAGYNPKMNPYDQVIGWVDNAAKSWNTKGKYYKGVISNYDLFMKPETKTIKGWMNIYNDNRTSKIHKSKEIADNAASDDRIACVEVEVSYEI